MPGTNDYAELVIQAKSASLDTAYNLSLNNAGRDRQAGRWDVYRFDWPFSGADAPAPDQLVALTLQKYGTDAWCFDALELWYRSALLWAYYGTDPAGSRPGGGYLGPYQASGNIWLDDQGAVSLVRFTDKYIRYTANATSPFTTQNLWIQPTTCTSQQDAGRGGDPGDNDSGILLQITHDGLIDQFWLDQYKDLSGNWVDDRELGKTDAFQLNAPFNESFSDRLVWIGTSGQRRLWGTQYITSLGYYSWSSDSWCTAGTTIQSTTDGALFSAVTHWSTTAITKLDDVAPNPTSVSYNLVSAAKPKGIGPFVPDTGTLTRGYLGLPLQASSRWSADALKCALGTNPALDACGNGDEDCDGTTDENFVSTLVSCPGQGACYREVWSFCDTTTGRSSFTCPAVSPAQEVCNGVDDDCDGVADAQEPAFSSLAELCDGVDNNCNGNVDDVPWIPVTCGYGVCQGHGFTRCAGGAPVTECYEDYSRIEADNDQDGIDDDCDGQVDEEPPGPPLLVAAPTASVLEGVAPLGVFFDASATEGLAAGNFLEADIRWNFGDAAAGSYVTTGKTKNRASGFVTGHVFEAPGTYEVQATIVDVAGTVMQTQPLTIVVRAFEGESRCLSVSGDFSGAPAGCDLQTTTDLPTAMRWVTAGENRRLLLHRGERWSLSEPLYLGSIGTTWIGSFGPESAASPGIDCDNLDEALAFGGQDVRVVDLELAHGGIVFSGENQVALRVNVHDGPWVGFSLGGRQLFVADSRVERQGYFAVFADGSRMSLTGNTIDQMRVATSFLRPAAQSRDVYVAHNVIDAVRSPPSTGIKWHSRRGVITDNLLVAGISRIAVTTDDGAKLSSVDEDLGILLIERNIMRLSINGSRPSNDTLTDAGVSFNTHHDVVIRTNLMSGMSRAFVASGGGAEPVASSVRIYNNSISKIRAAGINRDEGDFLSLGAPPVDLRVYNNVIAVEDSRAYGVIRLAGNLKPSDLSGLSIDNNVYFHSIGNLNRFLYADDASFGRTFDDWRARGFDAHSSFGSPAYQSVDPNDPSFLMLTGTSACIDAGSAVPNAYDFGGDARRSGAGVDVGAYEYGAE